MKKKRPRKPVTLYLSHNPRWFWYPHRMGGVSFVRADKEVWFFRTDQLKRVVKFMNKFIAWTEWEK